MFIVVSNIRMKIPFHYEIVAKCITGTHTYCI